MVDGKEVLRPVTLANLILAVIIGALATIAAKNIPALLEVVVLRNLPFDAGSRYAMTTLCRYAIVTVGAIAAFHAIGVGWDQVRWLVAAVGLGLGFGLQEIFANLVSGIMILFERPFRVGDVVSVGDMTGIVSKIRIRATTILDWDHREHFIPNKTFITDRLINWTLSDQITRLVVKIGIAHGSDTVQAQAVLLEAARSHPLVLAEPPPTVFFVGFAESSLDFEVRVFVSKIDDRMPVLHDINTAIDKALREKGIGIPFPRRDIHIRSREGG
jgi:potassium efflux system protein